MYKSMNSDTKAGNSTKCKCSKVNKQVQVKISDIKYRYDVYQMFNLFYNSYKIDFVDSKEDFSIDINDNKIICKSCSKCREYDIEKEVKRGEAIRRAVYYYLNEITGKKLPWGILVGIRPSKIAMELIEKGKSDEEILNYYEKHYLAERNKAGLCIEIARSEKKKLDVADKKISIYIGMPFCPTRCLYCSFTSNPVNSCKRLVKPYLKALYKEMESTAKYIDEKNLSIQNVYFGGGTPTAVSDLEFRETMKQIYEVFVAERNIEEFTVECGRPDSITEDKLMAMKLFKTNRISINPQSMNDDTLKLIGRHHSVKDVVDKFMLARNYEFDNINMDIIVGLPGEGIKQIENTCREIMKLKPESFTVHGLSIKRGSALHEAIINNKSIEEIQQGELNKMYERTAETARSMGMKPYYMYKQKNMVGNAENVGYSLPGKEGIYNIMMIEEKQTIIALGADGVSKMIFPDENRIERFPNLKDVREYINRVDEMIERRKSLLDSLY